jgi:SAM-dependent methyltransferase
VNGVYGFLGQDGAVDELQSTYDNLASGPLGDTSAGVGYNSSVIQRYVIAAFRRLCRALPADARILDVGCGNGIFWEALWDRRPALGVDYSLAMCARAQARGLKAYQANAFALPFADAQFDLVYCAETLQCIDDAPALFAEFARVCRPGGHVVVSSSNAASLLRRVMKATRRLKPHPVWGASREMIHRTAEQMDAAARGLPLKSDMVCWTHFPFPMLRCQASTRNMLEWASTNVAVRFVKQPSS